MSKVVAVCGATGQQGGGTLEALLRLGGISVQALTRDPASKASQKLAEKGVEVVQADFEDPASLRAAFEGADAVFAVTDFWKACGMDPVRELNQGKNLVDAAKAAGVKHFVWSTLDDTRSAMKDLVQPVTGTYTVPHFDAKGEVEAYLHEQLPGRWSCVLPSVFYDNFLPGKDMAPAKQPDGSFLLILPVGNAKLSWCSTPDIGNVATAIIAGGPQTYAGQTVIPVTPPADAWVEQLKGYGMPEVAAKDLKNMCVFYEKVGMLENRKVEDTAAVYPGGQDFDAWLKDHKEAMLSGMA